MVFLKSLADVIVIREYDERDLYLDPEEVQLLRGDYSAQIDLVPTGKASWYKIISKQYVGFIALPSGRKIEIQPKVRIGVLFAMLAKAHDLGKFLPKPVGQATVEELFEFIVEKFCSLMEDLVAHGILRNFENFQENLIPIKGKLLLTESLRHNPGVIINHHCDFTLHTPDILENQILKLACYSLLPFNYKIPLLNGRLRRILGALADVSLNYEGDLDTEKIEYHRLNEHYRPVLLLAKMLLNNLSPSGKRGAESFQSFLIDMNTLFEKYIEKILEDAAVKSGLSCKTQDTNYLALGNQIQVKPDVVIYDRLDPMLAIDAKYKTNDPNADIYQALAYCHALKIPKTILVYPESQGVTKKRFRIQPDGEYEIGPAVIDLSGSVEELNDQANQFTEALLAEI